MRKVFYKKWIPKVMDENKLPKEGTGVWQSEFENVGLFHQWASASEELSIGAANYTVALVENEDGTIEEVLPCHIKFTETKFMVMTDPISTSAQG